MCHLADWLWQRSFQQSPLAWDAMFAVVITVFMGASHSALAFIYDSQKGHKRRERGWSLWLLLFAIARPCLAHPLVRAGIPSLITGHPPCCRSNAAIKAVWESGAFVQLECSAINRLRTKVINCVTKEVRAKTEDGKERASARLPHRLHLKGFSPWRGLTTSSQFAGWRLYSALRSHLPPGGAIGTNVTAVDPFAFKLTQVKYCQQGLELRWLCRKRMHTQPVCYNSKSGGEKSRFESSFHNWACCAESSWGPS